MSCTKDTATKKVFGNKCFWITTAAIVMVILSISIIYIRLVPKSFDYGWQQTLGEVFFITGLAGGIIFVISRIVVALITRKTLQEKGSSLTKTVLGETITCLTWGAICFGLGWLSKERADLGLLFNVYFGLCGFLGVIIGADCLRRLSQSRIAWQVLLVFGFYMGMHIVIKPEGYNTTIRIINPIMFLFMLTYTIYYLIFGIHALKEPFKRTKGLESIKKLTVGIFCF